jgi:hypothetical protein
VPQGPASPLNALISFLQNQLGHAYVRGATGQNGAFDCSGLVTAAYQQLGISLPPLTYSQVKYGQGVDVAHIQPGDLVFFNGDGGRDFGHVGIYIGGGQYIQAASTKTGVIQSRLDPGRVQAVRRVMDGNGAVIKGDGLLPGHASSVPVVAAAAAGPGIPTPRRSPTATRPTRRSRRPPATRTSAPT